MNRAWRLENPDESPDLRGADLQFIDLRTVDFTEADLTGALLTFTNLNLANLNGADLERAHLDDTTLREADLRYASLYGAHMEHTDLSFALVHGANFAAATLNGSVLGGVNLSECEGLADVHHVGPSLIGLDTFRMSGGNIPVPFLRGCGLSDWEIQIARLYDKTLKDPTDVAYRIVQLRGSEPIRFFSAFISYSHANKRFAQRLHDALQDSGVRCWLDDKQLLPGDDIYEHVDRGNVSGW